jgi:hypothetical protein
MRLGPHLFLPVLAVLQPNLEVRWVVWCPTAAVVRCKLEVFDLQVHCLVVPRIASRSLNAGSERQASYLVQILKPVLERALNLRCFAFRTRSAWLWTGISNGHTFLECANSRSISCFDIAREWWRSPSAPHLFLITSITFSTSAESTGFPSHLWLMALKCHLSRYVSPSLMVARGQWLSGG